LAKGLLLLLILSSWNYSNAGLNGLYFENIEDACELFINGLKIYLVELKVAPNEE
jgi:hypothetical protein